MYLQLTTYIRSRYFSWLGQWRGTRRTYQRIVSTHVLQYLWPQAIVCTASLRRPSHLGHKFFLSITVRSVEDNSYPGIVGLKVDANTKIIKLVAVYIYSYWKTIEQQANISQVNWCYVKEALPSDKTQKVATERKMKSRQETTSLGQIVPVTAKSRISHRERWFGQFSPSHQSECQEVRCSIRKMLTEKLQNCDLMVSLQRIAIPLF